MEDKTLQVLYWIWEKNTRLDISTYPVRKLISEAHPKQIDADEKRLDQSDSIINNAKVTSFYFLF